MSNNKGHTYNITLDLQSSAASKQVLKELQTAFANSKEDMDALNDTVKAILKNTEDVEAAEKQYNKVVEKSLADRAEQIDKLNAEKVAIIANKDLTEEQRREALRLRDIQIDLLDNERKSIEAKRKEVDLVIKAAKAVKAEQEHAKKLAEAREKELRLRKTLGQLVKADLVTIKDKVKEQLKFIEALKTTEGRYKAIKKIAATGAKAGVKAGGFALKAGGALALAGIAAGGAVAGSVMGAAGDIAAKETAIKGLKSGLTREDVEKVFISTGGDYSTIVTEINKLSRKFKGDDLIAATIQAVKNPGFADVLMASTEFKTSTKNLGHVIEQIKRSSGVLDLSEAMVASTQSESVGTKKIAQRDYIQAYASLQSVGLDEEKINSIIDDIASKSGHDPNKFVDTFNKTDLSKYVEGQQQIQLQGIKLNNIDATKASAKTPAEEFFEVQNKFTLTKDKLMMKVLPPLTKILEELLNNPNIESLITNVVDMFINVLPPVMEVLKIVLDLLKPVADTLIKGMVAFFNTDAPQAQQKAIAQANEDASKLRSEGNYTSAWGMSMGNAVYAQGGIATTPSICGEAGPELIIPLDNSRSGRASQIVNNFNTNQNFNMSANQTTPLAFAQAVGQNRFVRRTAC